MFTIAIVGRPNVGKSTLFNKLSIGKKTIVHDAPGVTRDFTKNKASIGGLEFDLIDSAGLFEKANNDLDQKIYDHTINALKSADLLLFVVDGQAGLTSHDTSIAKTVRKLDKQVLLVINKCDGKSYRNNISDFDRLGFQHSVYISSEHKSGFIDLHDSIKSFITHDNITSVETIDKKNVIKVAIVGKPNTGKSTFINKVLEQERLITGPEAGVTRDAVNIMWKFKGYIFELTDTAGLRKSGRIKKDTIEQYSISQTISAVNTANIVILLNDINDPLLKQDLKIANLALKEGKPVILAFNKIDIFKDLEGIKDKLNKYAQELINNVQNFPIFYFSAKNDKSFDKVFDQVIKLYNKWNEDISKKNLNAWLEYATEQHSPPIAKNSRRIRLKYIVQSASRPPTFKVFANIAEDLPQSYIKYLSKSLQSSFNLEQVPVRIILQKNYNPYQ